MVVERILRVDILRGIGIGCSLNLKRRGDVLQRVGRIEREDTGSRIGEFSDLIGVNMEQGRIERNDLGRVFVVSYRAEFSTKFPSSISVELSCDKTVE